MGQGYQALPDELVDVIGERLNAEQFRMFVMLRRRAQYGEPAELRDAFGRAFTVDVGEVVVSIEGEAERLRVSRDQVRRALEAFERTGLAARRRAVEATTPSATPPEVSPATPQASRSATPPTVLRFLTHREISWPTREAATPHRAAPATPSATPPAPKPPPSHLEHLTPEALEAGAPPPAKRSRRAEGEPPSVFRTAQLALVDAFREATGAAYQWQGAKDTKALQALLHHGPELVLERWRAGLAAEGWLRVATVAQLGAKFNDLATARAPRRPARPAAAPALDDLRAQLERAGREEMAERGHPEAPRLPGKLLAGARAARLEGDALVLEADRFAGALLEDARESVERWGARVTGRAVRLEVRAAGAALAAAGSAA